MNIALPKGRLYHQLSEMFSKLGIQLPQETRQYFFKDFFGKDINLFIAKPKAIPQLLESNLCQYGFCGSDLMKESMVDTNLMVSTDFNSIDIVLATKRNYSFPKNRPVICATEFPNISSSYFSTKGIPHYILQTGGGTEGYSDIGADCIIDICETGDTLRQNNLEIKEYLAKSSTCLYSSLSATNHPDIIKTIINYLNH